MDPLKAVLCVLLVGEGGGSTLQSSLILNPAPDDCRPCAYFRKFTLGVRVEWDQRREHGRNLGQWSRKKEMEP